VVGGGRERSNGVCNIFAKVETEVSSFVRPNDRVPQSRSRQWLRRGAIVVGILLVLWLILSSAVAYRLTHRPRPPFEERPPRVVWGELEDHPITTSDGETLGSWFWKGDDDLPIVLLLHGSKGSRWNSLTRAEIFASHGCGVLMISFRAHGDSTGNFHDVGYSSRRDVIAAVEYLETRRSGRPVVIMGTSLGAAAAVFAANELGQRVQAYILESPYQDLKTIGGIPKDVPVLILAGDADRLARPFEAQALFSQVASHGKLVFFPGADHNNLPQSSPELFKRTLLEFCATR
jgi:uncharacterized protein